MLMVVLPLTAALSFCLLAWLAIFHLSPRTVREELRRFEPQDRGSYWLLLLLPVNWISVLCLYRWVPAVTGEPRLPAWLRAYGGTMWLFFTAVFCSLVIHMNGKRLIVVLFGASNLLFVGLVTLYALSVNFRHIKSSTVSPRASIGELRAATVQRDAGPPHLASRPSPTAP